VFQAGADTALPVTSDGFIWPLDDDLDREIFDAHFLDRGVMRRYRLDGFQIAVTIDAHETSPTVIGEVQVRATRYFDDTVCVSYRLMASTSSDDVKRFGFAESSSALTTDHLILLAGMASAVENWHATADDDDADFVINRPVHRCDVSEVRLSVEGQRLRGPGGAWHDGEHLLGRSEVFQDVILRYRRFLLGKSDDTTKRATDYCLLDIWESISHTPPVSFTDMESGDIIAHIEEHHRSELMGLLTLYPYEWPYRDARYYRRVCGDNIAIDTDDLVLVTHNVALVMGTYGKRGAGSPTPWKQVLERTRREHHVSWGEYLRILEIVIAKVHTINSAHGKLQPVHVKGKLSGENEEQIRRNSIFALSVGHMIVDMNAVTFSRYLSHKVMYEQTEVRLDVAADLHTLTASLSQIDKAMHNLDSIDQARRARILNRVLLAISIASLFQLVFQPVSIPLLQEMIDEAVAKFVGSTIISVIAVALVIAPMAAALYFALQVISRFRRKLKRT
jgi:hypothetical protein